MLSSHAPSIQSGPTWRSAASVLVPIWAVVALIILFHLLFPGTPHPNAAAIAHAAWFRQTTCGSSLQATGPARTVAISPHNAVARACSADTPGDAPVFIALMSIRQARSWDTNLQKSRHQSWEWLVTVHADKMTEGSLVAPPTVQDVYSLSINATTGWYDDYCIGCALLG